MFECAVIVYPPHEILWNFNDSNGERMEEVATTKDGSRSDKYSINSNRTDAGFGELTVNNVQFEDHGTYVCIATNSIDSREAQADLIVHGKLVISNIVLHAVSPMDVMCLVVHLVFMLTVTRVYPIFLLAVIPVVRNISEPSDTQLSEPVAIFCLVTGYPIPTITWQQDRRSCTGQDARVSIFSFTSQVVNGTSEFESSDFEEGSGGVSISDLLLMNTDVTPDEITLLGELGVVSVLSIDSVVREDTGNYTCAATNQLPETRVINVTSSQVPLLVIGEC